jgi:hypothetical protein
VTGSDRIIALASYVVAFLLLFAAAAALGANLGPIEFIIVLVLAIPAAILLARGLRAVTSRNAHPRV